MIGEIAARLSGGYMSGWTYPYSCGVQPTRGAIEIALGKKPSRTCAEWNWTAAERAFISIPGTVRSVENLERARAMPWVKDVFTRIKPGSAVIFPENNVTKCGNVISAAPGRPDAVNAAENAARSILIRLEAPNAATEAFLSVPPGKTGFPPDAFTADSRLLALLNTLPEGDLNDISPRNSTTNQHKPTRTINPNGDCHLFPFLEFCESGLKDYMGRGVQESLDAVRFLTGMELPITENPGADAVFFGQSFWRALIRGGYQGAVYYIDSLRSRNE